VGETENYCKRERDAAIRKNKVVATLNNAHLYKLLGF
jgi:hypothetical protein